MKKYRCNDCDSTLDETRITGMSEPVLVCWDCHIIQTVEEFFAVQLENESIAIRALANARRKAGVA